MGPIGCKYFAYKIGNHNEQNMLDGSLLLGVKHRIELKNVQIMNPIGMQIGYNGTHGIGMCIN